MAHPGTTHKYTNQLVAFEHTGSATPANDAPNTLLWIGGLGDGLLTVQYPTAIASSLPPSWVLAEVLLSSSYSGWATGSLARDARELGECVAYFKQLRPGAKVVLMGHSTGCQDIMEYLVGQGADTRAALDGAILQGGLSDREAWASMITEAADKQKFAALLSSAASMIDAGNASSVMSADNMVAQTLGAPMSAYRTHSLLAAGGDDDYFSSDLDDDQLAKTFGNIPNTVPVCFLLGAKDPYVPAHVDKIALQRRWTLVIRQAGGVVDEEHGGVVPGAGHNLNGDAEEVVQDLVRRVCGFLGKL